MCFYPQGYAREKVSETSVTLFVEKINGLFSKHIQLSRMFLWQTVICNYRFCFPDCTADPGHCHPDGHRQLLHPNPGCASRHYFCVPQEVRPRGNQSHQTSGWRQ